MPDVVFLGVEEDSGFRRRRDQKLRSAIGRSCSRRHAIGRLRFDLLLLGLGSRDKDDQGRSRACSRVAWQRDPSSFQRAATGQRDLCVAGLHLPRWLRRGARSRPTLRRAAESWGSPMKMPKPATLGSEELLGYGLRPAELLTLAEGLSTRSSGSSLPATCVGGLGGVARRLQIPPRHVAPNERGSVTRVAVPMVLVPAVAMSVVACDGRPSFGSGRQRSEGNGND